MPGMRSDGRQHGFSLLELLAVLAIVGILAAIAWPGYRHHVTGTRRILATTCLMQHAQALERHYARRHSYLDAPEPAPCRDSAAFYRIGFAVPPTAGAYVLQAVPQGAQAVLDACGTLTLNQRGERGSSAGSDGLRCW